MQRVVRKTSAAVLLLAATVASAQSQQTPPPGVYGCYSARSVQGAPGCMRTSLGCFGMQIQVAPTVMFGLIDGSTYSDYDGKKGHYSYDKQSGVLTMTDGSRKGWTYKRVDFWAFRMMDPQ